MVKNSKYFFIIMEQILFSGTTFLISILSGRWLSVADYGLFAIIYSIIILFGLVQDAIINQPFVIYSSNKYKKNTVELYYKITKSILMLLIFLIIITLIFISLVDGKLKFILQSIIVALPGIVFMNFYRRVWHIKQKPFNNVITGLVFLIFICFFFTFYKYTESLSLFKIFFAIGISAICASLTSTYLFKYEKQLNTTTGDILKYKEIFINFFNYSRWALLASVFIWASNDIYYFILSKSSMDAAGEFRLIKNLFLPFIHVMVGINYYLLPAMSKNSRVRSPFRINTAWFIFFFSAILYSAIIIIFSEQIFEFIYKKEIVNITSLVTVCIFIPLLFGITSLFTTFLRATENIRTVFYVHFSAVCISITVWQFVIKTINVYTAIISWNLVFLLIVSIYCYFYKLRMSNGR